MTTEILWIEGNQRRAASFVVGLRAKGYQVETAANGKAALKRAEDYLPNLAVVHAPSLRTNGSRICDSLREHMNGNPILLIADPRNQPEPDVEANQVLVLPFTLRKLVNRIRDLLPNKNEPTLKAGPIVLYPNSKVVQIRHGEPQRLNPHMMGLLRLLMEQPGKVLNRSDLFREV